MICEVFLLLNRRNHTARLPNAELTNPGAARCCRQDTMDARIYHKLCKSRQSYVGRGAGNADPHGLQSVRYGVCREVHERASAYDLPERISI